MQKRPMISPSNPLMSLDGFGHEKPLLLDVLNQ
jgi:hypothetical protein